MQGVFSISSIVTLTAFMMLRAMVSPNMTSKIFSSGGGVVALIALISFYWTPSTEGVESTRGNSVCLWIYLFVRNHCFLLRILDNLMVYSM